MDLLKTYKKEENLDYIYDLDFNCNLDSSYDLDFEYNLNIRENVLNLDINDYLDLAIRNNNKRRFLFISKVLGKHLPCNAVDMDNLGKSIVKAYEKQMDYLKNPLVISFAETGTALGHSVFNYINTECEFIHTTREIIEGKKTLDFLEEHSHATNHNLYYEDLSSLKTGEEVILVDDEVTTGNTCINLIKKINELFPKKRYTICSILNWMNKAAFDKFVELQEELNIEIQFVYLFSGNFEFICDEEKVKKIIEKKEAQNTVLERVNRDLKINYIHLDMNEYENASKYLKYTGRFGINKNDQIDLLNNIKRESKKLKISKDEKCLFLGTEEFMYIPMQFAKQFGENVYYHSTTRSPIVDLNQDMYPIKSKFCHHSLYNENIKNYMYNVDKYNYEKCFLFSELNHKEERFEEIINIISNTNIKELNIIICNH